MPYRARRRGLLPRQVNQEFGDQEFGDSALSCQEFGDSALNWEFGDSAFSWYYGDSAGNTVTVHSAGLCRAVRARDLSALSPKFAALSPKRAISCTVTGIAVECTVTAVHGAGIGNVF